MVMYKTLNMSGLGSILVAFAWKDGAKAEWFGYAHQPGRMVRLAHLEGGRGCCTKET